MQTPSSVGLLQALPPSVYSQNKSSLRASQPTLNFQVSSIANNFQIPWQFPSPRLCWARRQTVLWDFRGCSGRTKGWRKSQEAPKAAHTALAQTDLEDRGSWQLFWVLYELSCHCKAQVSQPEWRFWGSVRQNPSTWSSGVAQPLCSSQWCSLPLFLS